MKDEIENARLEAQVSCNEQKVIACCSEFELFLSLCHVFITPLWINVLCKKVNNREVYYSVLLFSLKTCQFRHRERF